MKVERSIANKTVKVLYVHRTQRVTSYNMNKY